MLHVWLLLLLLMWGHHHHGTISRVGDDTVLRIGVVWIFVFVFRKGLEERFLDGLPNGHIFRRGFLTRGGNDLDGCEPIGSSLIGQSVHFRSQPLTNLIAFLPGIGGQAIRHDGLVLHLIELLLLLLLLLLLHGMVGSRIGCLLLLLLW